MTVTVKPAQTISTDRRASLGAADIVLRLRKPPMDEAALMKPGCLHVGFLDPFNDLDLVRALAAAGVSAVSMQMIPRSTVAQKMDALSSQANLAGYISVIIAAERLGKIFPMMTTPAGTIRPAKVFVIGVGVAGLQAIATAKRLGRADRGLRYAPGRRGAGPVPWRALRQGRPRRDRPDRAGLREGVDA